MAACRITSRLFKLTHRQEPRPLCRKAQYACGPRRVAEQVRELAIVIRPLKREPAFTVALHDLRALYVAQNNLAANAFSLHAAAPRSMYWGACSRPRTPSAMRAPFAIKWSWPNSPSIAN